LHVSLLMQILCCSTGLRKPSADWAMRFSTICCRTAVAICTPARECAAQATDATGRPLASWHMLALCCSRHQCISSAGCHGLASSSACRIEGWASLSICLGQPRATCSVWFSQCLACPRSTTYHGNTAERRRLIN
jgi:hypothetical protein